MEPTPSFAPFAARLAGHAAALRPAQGGRDGFGPAVMATVWLLLLEFLIRLCEALDARAAIEAAGAVAAPAPRAVKADAIPAPRAIRQAPLGGMRALRLTLVPQLQAATPDQANAPSGSTGRPAGLRLAWSCDPGPIPAVPWRPHRETRLSHQRSRTSLSLRYRNYKLLKEGFVDSSVDDGCHGCPPPPAAPYTCAVA